MKKTRVRLFSLLLALVMIVQLAPLDALADATEARAHILVENSTADAASGSWSDGVSPWSGVKLDTWIAIQDGDTAFTAAKRAIEAAGLTITASGDYVTEIAGLKADETSSAGWMATYNDWFTNETLGSYALSDGDEVHFVYSLLFGGDVGGIANDTTKTLKALAVTGGALEPAFSSAKTQYELALGEGQTSGTVTVTPTATNKNFQVRIYKSTAYNAADTGYKRGAAIAVSAGDTLQVVVGDPAWPSMNNGAYGGAEKVPAGVYTIQIVETATPPAADFASFFTALDGIAAVENDTVYPWTAEAGGEALVSGNAGQHQSESAIQLTFQKAAALTFAYRTSSETRWDFLKISKNGTALNDSYQEKANFSGEMTDYGTYTVEAEAGDVVRIAFTKDTSGSGGSDCAWVKDFTVALPYQVTFHANDGTGETAVQGVFAGGHLQANPFEREKLRFDGWAETPDGEVVYADGAAITLTADLDLYAKWTKCWYVTFPAMPAGTKLTVSQNGSVIEPVKAGTWLLPDGVYTFDASLFGYETITGGTFTVAGQDYACPATLTESARYEIRFDVTPADAAILVTNAEGTIMDPANGALYRLPSGSYTYIIKAKGYKTVHGELTADRAQTIAVTMTETHVWDGETLTEPALINGVYQIASGEELAWFAAQVNAGSRTLDAVLIADIELGDADTVRDFTPIGKSAAESYLGSFSGNGHTIQGLHVAGTERLGLFGVIGETGCVERLLLTQVSVEGKSNVGAVAGENNGTIRACAVLDGAVTQNVYANSGIGGIAGKSSGTIAYCFNGAALIRGHKKTNYGFFGGIAGEQTGTVESCYNLGSIQQAYYAGGIAGKSTGRIQNCFNAGSIASTSNKAIAGYKGYGSNSKVENCYYLDACGASDSNATAKTADEMQSLAALLGGSFVDGTAYPLLKWQTPDAQYTVTITAVPAEATVVLMRGGTALTARSAENGTFIFDVPAGDYTYTVSCGTGDYAPEEGALTVAYADESRTVELKIRRYAVTFRLVPADAALTLKQGEQVLTPGTDGSYALPNGTYSYSAEAFGYQTAAGTVTVDGAPVDTEVTLTRQTGAEVTFAIQRTDGTFAEGQPAITVTHTDSGRTFALTNQEPHFFPSGAYTYVVKAPTLGKLTGAFTVAEEPLTITGEMSYSAVWDGETSVEPQKRDGIYLISNGYELAWYRDQVNQTAYGSYTTGAELTQDIDLGGCLWTPIWAYKPASQSGTITSEKRGYNAVFDGAGHTIRGLNVECSEQGAGLFGIVYKNGVIRNLTVEGRVCGTQYVGGIAGLLAGGRIESCVNAAEVTTAKQNSNAFLGGITGCMANYTDQSASILDCVNEGTVNGGTNGYVGGIVGSSSYGVSIARCLNSGTVSGKDSVGGISGTGAVPITGCVNTGAVTGTANSVGGITGFLGANAALRACLNTGAVSGAGSKQGVGGIVGRLHSAYKATITSVYNAGAVTATGDLVGAIAGSKGDDTACITNAWYLDTSAALAIGSNAAEDDMAQAVNAQTAQSKRFAATLGGSFAWLAEAETPVLDWQSDDARHVQAFFCTPEAAVQVTDASGETVTAAEPGVYLLETGIYHYQITKEKYNTVSGSFDAAEGSQRMDVTLEAETFAVTFHVTPADAVITVYSDGTLAGTGNELNLPNGSYTYRVEKFGYETAHGTLTVADAPVDVPEIVLTQSPTYAVTLLPDFGGQTAAYTLDISCESVLIAHVTDATPVSLPNGTYTYVCKAAGWFDAAGEFTVANEAKTVAFVMALRTTWDGTTKTEPAKSGDVYQIASAEELAWFAETVNGGNTSLHAILTAEIWINDEQTQNTWVSIGTYDHPYNGVFDGAGHTIHGLNHELFGFNAAESHIKNLRVTGENVVTASNTSNVGGICRTSYGAFENCINEMKVHGTWMRTGGIVGILYNTGRIENCANFGEISTSHSANAYSSYNITYLGGIVGYAYGPVSGCANFGTVIGGAESYGGIGGIAGVADGSVTNCYNMGEVRGLKRTGGIVGIENQTTASIVNCYNAGKIVCTETSTSGQPFCGAIVGTVTDAQGSGETVATVENCYYLENSFYQKRAETIYHGGIGYGTGDTESKTADEMKAEAFVLALGEAFRQDDGQNDGYPILAWQGGSQPDVDEDRAAVAADKAALTIRPTIVKQAMTLQLPASGENGTTIVWTSSNAAVIAADGRVTLPAGGSVTVTLTAAISRGQASDTKTFEITVWSALKTAQHELDSLKELLSGVLNPVYGTDADIQSCLRRMIDGKLTDDFVRLKSANQLTITVSNPGEPADTAAEWGIAPSGTLRYFFRDPAQSGASFGIVSGVVLQLAMDGAETAVTMQVNLPWDAARVRTAMQPAKDALTFAAVQGANTSADAVDQNLTLPTSPEGYGWISLTWSSDHDEIIAVQPGTPGGAAGVGVVTRPRNDTAVTLHAELVFNLTQLDESAISIDHDIALTVRGEAGTRAQEMQRALDAYTIDRLTIIRTHEAVNPSDVIDDIQLLRPSDLELDGRDYRVEVLPSNEAASVNGYRLNVLRPLPGSPAVDAALTVRLTHKASGESLKKQIGTLHIRSLDQAEIDRELALMAAVKAHFFDGIKGENKYADHITKDLHAFREVYMNGTDLVWVYNISEETGAGIRPVDLPKTGYDESYNLFHSSNPAVIAHENLLVTRPSETQTVTITACLSSEQFARYAEKYPENASFAALNRQIVTADVTVLGASEDDRDWRDIRDAALLYLRTNLTQTDPWEWAVFANARFGQQAPAWYMSCLRQLNQSLVSGQPMDTADAERAVLALTALGLDASAYDVDGTAYDLIARVAAETDGKYRAAETGNTVLAFALLAIDAKPYDGPREAFVSLLVERQLTNGAWNINEKNPEANVDATAMALTALAPYASNETVRAAAEKALTWLAGKFENGFGSAETDAQVLTALSAWNINAQTDSRFTGLLDSLLNYAQPSGGFRHTAQSAKESRMPTEQAAYALVAYGRMLNGENRLYDMRDAQNLLPSAEVQTVIALIDALTVNDCKHETALKIQAIETLLAQLSEEERAGVTNTQAFAEKKAAFQTLLTACREQALETLRQAFEALDREQYTASFYAVLEQAYQDGCTAIQNAGDEEAVQKALSDAERALHAREETRITVTFSLTGDTEHGKHGHSGYQTWIAGSTYTLNEGATVYDLLIQALAEAGMAQIGAEQNYVSAIRAPASLGGFWLAQLDHGSGSGWVYAVNGEYPNVGLKDYVLRDGDQVSWHYVDNYAAELPGISGADRVTALIDALGYVTEEDAEAVQAARAAYDALTEAEKQAVENLKKLEKAEEILKKLGSPLPFDDVDGSWAKESIRYAYAYGLMNGVGGRRFAPQATMTRAMLVTILYRLAEAEPVDAPNPFSDVPADVWYTEAVVWAFENGIAQGNGKGEFQPDAPVTREQLAVMLRRYAVCQGKPSDAAGKLTAFADAGDVSAWAVDGMAWAVEYGMINGRTGGLLAPQACAARSEAAAMIIRFIRNILD